MMKKPPQKTLRQIQQEATKWAAKQAAREAENPKLKEEMDRLRAAEAGFYAQATKPD